MQWPLAWGTATLALGSLPYLTVWLLTPPGFTFSGLLVHPADGFSYLAKMREGWEGAWLFTLPYGTETHQPAPIYLFFLLLGHIARWTGLPLIAVYHAARVPGGALLLIAFWDLLGLFCPSDDGRRLAFALGCLGAGLGWLALPFGVLTPDLTVPEGSIFFSLLANPHFPVALAGFAGSVSCSIRALERDSFRWMLAAMVCAAGMAVIHPHLVPALAIVLAFLVVAGWRNGGSPLLKLARVAGIVAVAAVPAAVQTWALMTDPVLAVWSAQNRTPSPSLRDLLIGLGTPGILATVGAFSIVRQGPELGIQFHASGVFRYVTLPYVGTLHWVTWTERRESRPVPMLALAWLLATLVLLYVPVAFQRRYYEGIEFPLAALGGTGAAVLLQRSGRARLAAVGLLALAVPSTLLNAILPVLGSAQPPNAVAISANDRAAYAWLAANAERGDVVLAGPVHGNQLPAYASVRVVWGHPFETVDSAAKLAEIRNFFGGERTGDAVALLQREHVTLVYLGEEERRMAMVDAWALGGATEVFGNGNVRVLRLASARP
jgi:hypothetical protein